MHGRPPHAPCRAVPTRSVPAAYRAARWDGTYVSAGGDRSLAPKPAAAAAALASAPALALTLRVCMLLLLVCRRYRCGGWCGGQPASRDDMGSVSGQLSLATVTDHRIKPAASEHPHWQAMDTATDTSAVCPPLPHTAAAVARGLSPSHRCEGATAAAAACTASAGTHDTWPVMGLVIFTCLRARPLDLTLWGTYVCPRRARRVLVGRQMLRAVRAS
jgi:hypothetical protein